MINSEEKVDRKLVDFSEIKYKETESTDFLINNKLIVNSEQGNLLNELKTCLNECTSFYFSVAFINFSGLQLLLDSFKSLEERNITGKIVTSTYLNFTEPKALKKIKSFKNIDLKVFVATKELGFHTKAYVFEMQDEYKIIIGSSNITQRALKSNIEWNVQVISKKDNSFSKEVLDEYLNLWNVTSNVDKEFLDRYSEFISKLKKVEKNNKINFNDYELIKPNSMQQRAVENLQRLRLSGEEKALVISATGTGKTYMSAFDVLSFKPKKMLFLVHREEILISAEKTFRRLVKNKDKSMGLLTGSEKDIHADYLFANIKSMNINLDKFEKDEFEYIVIDEAHHSTSPSYQRVISYFKPKFLLGMTATPERSDGENIFEVFGNNVALEVRLREALDLNIVIPFHYFGITDVESIDLSSVDINNISEISKRLRINERVDFIIEKMNFYGHDGQKRKCVGFCANIEHAKYMSEQFNKMGIVSTYLTSKNNSEERTTFIKKLESDEDELEVIFTVDLFNEGVDIPSINLILMLRPTESPIVFIQQLGRGLRKHDSKEFLTILDFIGNHNKAFLIAIALNGSRFYDKDSLKVAVATEFANIPGCTNIQMDRISQERILDQLNNENFNSMKYLKEEYMEFKKMNGYRVPYMLMDYLKFDGSPDPVKFINKKSTYLGFVAEMEKDDELTQLLADNTFFKIYKELSSKLPIKRIYEFSIIKYLISNDEISFEQSKKEILKYIENVDDESVLHALKCLNQNYYDSGQLKNNIRCFDLNSGNLRTTLSFKKIVLNKKYRNYIEDVVNYSLLRYEKEIEIGIMEYHFLNYMNNIGWWMQHYYQTIRKFIVPFRGSGLITNGKEYFLFIDLHKDDDIKDSINYNDKFIDRDFFQWQSPNSTAQKSERGQNIINNKVRKINLHIFVRKYKQIDGVVQEYIYLGKGDTVEYYGEKPITVKLKLEKQVPIGIYTEFVKKV